MEDILNRMCIFFLRFCCDVSEYKQFDEKVCMPCQARQQNGVFTIYEDKRVE